MTTPSLYWLQGLYVNISCLSSNMPSSHFMGPPSLPSWTCGLYTTCSGRDKGASGRLHLTFPWATMVTWSCPLISSMPWKCSKVLLATLDLIQPIKHNHQYAPLWMLSYLPPFSNIQCIINITIFCANPHPPTLPCSADHNHCLFNWHWTPASTTSQVRKFGSYLGIGIIEDY